METFIFAVGLCVSTMVVYGIFSLVPREIRPPEKVIYYGDGKEISSLNNKTNQ